MLGPARQRCLIAWLVQRLGDELLCVKYKGQSMTYQLKTADQSSVQRVHKQNFWSVSPSTLQIARDMSVIEIGLFLMESTKKFASN